jgi:hypothetical protein
MVTLEIAFRLERVARLSLYRAIPSPFLLVWLGGCTASPCRCANTSEQLHCGWHPAVCQAYACALHRPCAIRL